MSKTKLAIAFTASALLLVLLCQGPAVPPARAAAGYAVWYPVAIPQPGTAGNWTLAPGSDLGPLAIASDGTLYCYATPAGTSFRLFKSSDGGQKWAPTGNVVDTIVAIATSPDDATTIYYATVGGVFRSVDSGANFTPLPANPGGSGAGNVRITGIDVATGASGETVIVATADDDPGEYGGVYTLHTADPLAAWADTGLSGLDAYAVAFSPHFTSDAQMLAVTGDGTDSFVLTRTSATGWGATLTPATVAGVAAVAASIAFPDDYDATAESGALFVGLDTGTDSGNVYRVVRVGDDQIATALDTGLPAGTATVDIASLAVSGNAATASLLAGAAGSSDIHASSDGGATWVVAGKPPTGQSGTVVLMATDFPVSGVAYAATSGIESAFSRTSDRGIVWNQTALVDTTVDAIIDFAISPAHPSPPTLFAITQAASIKSLWRSDNDGMSWQRLLTTTAAGVDNLSLIEPSANYGTVNRTVYLAGSGSGVATVWQSSDDGETFTAYAAPFELSAWTVAGDDLLIAGVDGDGARVYRFAAGAFLPAAGAPLGTAGPTTLAVSPNYANDGTVLAGDFVGQVYLSTDGGASFAPLGQPLPLNNGIGEVSVAFDTGFTGNRAVYAASRATVSAQSQQRLFRLTLGTGTTWQSIVTTLSDGATVGPLVATVGGGLWATNSQPVNVAGDNGGALRMLDPTSSLGVTCETVIGDLEDGAVLEELWASSNRLWSLDVQNVKIMTFLDSLMMPPAPASPEKETPGLATDGLRLYWIPAPGAIRYHWQVNYDDGFASVPDGLEGTTGAISTRLPPLAPGTTYHWRVRATEPMLSPWSTAWSFTTILGSTTLELMSPKAGADSVSLAPVFQWSAVSGAESYELVVSTDSLFTDTVIHRRGTLALPATAWQSDTELEYDETYFWKVRGRSSNSFSAWSAVGAFTTATPPPPIPPPAPAPADQEETAPADPKETEPAPEVELTVETVVQAESIPVQFEPPPVLPIVAPTVEIAIPTWALATVIGLLATLVLLLITVLVIVGRVRRY